MKFIVDENVSFSVFEKLKNLDLDVISIVDKKYSGLKDKEIYELAIKEKAIIITRDYHFTNSFIFPPENTEGIIYIRIGNLTSEEEVNLIEKFINKFDISKICGKLVTLYKDGIKVRPSY